MGRQISFYRCKTMLAAIQSESERVGANLVTNYSSDSNVIQLSVYSGQDDQRGRLWTRCSNPEQFEALRRAVKKSAYFDRDTGLWVKRSSRVRFAEYKASRDQALADLVEANRKILREIGSARNKATNEPKDG